MLWGNILSRGRSSMKEIEGSIYGVDTNIQVYAFDKTDPKKQKITKEILEKCWKREKSLVVSSQSLGKI